MNPFDLPGPQFLLFYAMLGAGVLFAVYAFRQQAEGGEPRRLPSMDPYLIAFLRGGPVEAVRLGVAVLVDRQLLESEGGDRVVRRKNVRPTHGSNDLERAILEQCEKDVHPRELTETQRLLEIARRSYELPLLRLNMLATPETRQRRFRDVSVAIAVMVVVAGVKVAIGLARNRPVVLLVIFALGFAVLSLFLTGGRRTVLGERVLGDLTALFDGLRARAREMRPNTATNEFAMLMAVFGVSAVPVGAYPFMRAFGGVTTNSGTNACGASGCGGGVGGGGSSCGGGGSSCGGGGGCGGCGGS
jgi:uncharacterized protein (TIGR04222 family)